MFAEVALPLALTLIMGSLGLTLTPADFKRVFAAPRAIGIGLLNLLLISPLLAFGIGEVYGLTATLAVGVVLLGASPGGTTANMLTHLARGDVALSVSMTAVSSVASVLTVPLFLSLGAEHFGADDVSDEISMPGIAATVFLITVVPLSIGMVIRARRTAWALANMHKARRVALTAFVLVVAGAVASEFDTISERFTEIAAAVVTLNILAMSVSFFIARAAKLDGRQSTAIAMELGVHNTTVALAIATTVDEQLAAPAAVYGLFMFVTAGLFARIMSRRNAEPVPEGAVILEEELNGTPAQVWDLITTGDGLGSWFVPTRIGDGEVAFDLGALGTARARVVTSDPPRHFAFLDDQWRDGAPPLVTDLTVQDVGHGSCTVTVTSSLAAPAGAGHDTALAAAAASWKPHLVALRLRAARPGEAAHGAVLSAEVPGASDAVWAQVEQRLPDGEVVHRGPAERVLRLDGPTPGHLVASASDGADGTVVDVRMWRFGADAADAAARDQVTWDAWAAERREGAAAAPA